MPVIGPQDPSADRVNQATEKVLDLLHKDYHVFSCTEDYWVVNKDLRKERIQALHEAVFGLLQLEAWETW